MDGDAMMFYFARLANEAAVCCALGGGHALDRLRAALASFGNSAGAVLDMNALTDDDCRKLRFSRQKVTADGVWRIPMYLRGAIAGDTRLYDEDGCAVVADDILDVYYGGCLMVGVRTVGVEADDGDLTTAAARYAEDTPHHQDRRLHCREDFIAGARWMEARMKNPDNNSEEG